MEDHQYRIKAKIWLYSGIAAWHFITIPEQISQNIKETYSALKRGWGSLPVQITIGDSVWDTSIFPEKKTGTYILPLKALIRKKENISNGDTVNFLLKIKV